MKLQMASVLALYSTFTSQMLSTTLDLPQKHFTLLNFVNLCIESNHRSMNKKHEIVDIVLT